MTPIYLFIAVAIPDVKEWKLNKDASYVYYCANETVHGRCYAWSYVNVVSMSSWRENLSLEVDLFVYNAHRGCIFKFHIARNALFITDYIHGNEAYSLLLRSQS